MATAPQLGLRHQPLVGSQLALFVFHANSAARHGFIVIVKTESNLKWALRDRFTYCTIERRSIAPKGTRKTTTTRTHRAQRPGDWKVHLA